MTEKIKNTPAASRIVSHEFSGDTLKVLVEGPTMSALEGPEMKKAVYEYRHTIGASHMGLNKFEPAFPKTSSDNEGSPVRQGYWYLIAGL
jgi:hypothetical protein